MGVDCPKVVLPGPCLTRKTIMLEMLMGGALMFLGVVLGSAISSSHPPKEKE